MIPPRVEAAVSELEIEIGKMGKQLQVAEDRYLLMRDALCAYDLSMVQIKEARYTPSKTLAEAAKAADTLIGTASILFGVGDAGVHVASEAPTVREPLGSVYVIFDGPPGPTAGRFVEVEDASGRSIKVGRWIERGDGMWALELPRPCGDDGGAA